MRSVTDAAHKRGFWFEEQGPWFGSRWSIRTLTAMYIGGPQVGRAGDFWGRGDLASLDPAALGVLTKHSHKVYEGMCDLTIRIDAESE